MTLIDHQTGRDIISPYFLIGEEINFAINTETFRECQNWLVIEKNDRSKPISDFGRGLLGLLNTETIPVFAAIGDYNDFSYGAYQSVSVTKPIKYSKLIGTIPMEILKREIPKVYNSIIEYRDYLEIVRTPF
ncbi:MAG: hypothetical protein Q7S27_05630 [Nanoarchaeota archaeon]|nr:hypothetical protein [Nanoarchaeota archaeon]